MDNFGVDLDKVLDDFEESEASNIRNKDKPDDKYNRDDLPQADQQSFQVNKHNKYDNVFSDYAGDNDTPTPEYLKPTAPSFLSTSPLGDEVHDPTSAPDLRNKFSVNSPTFSGGDNSLTTSDIVQSNGAPPGSDHLISDDSSKDIVSPDHQALPTVNANLDAAPLSDAAADIISASLTSNHVSVDLQTNDITADANTLMCADIISSSLISDHAGSSNHLSEGSDRLRNTNTNTADILQPSIGSESISNMDDLDITTPSMNAIPADIITSAMNSSQVMAASRDVVQADIVSSSIEATQSSDAPFDMNASAHNDDRIAMNQHSDTGSVNLLCNTNEIKSPDLLPNDYRSGECLNDNANDSAMSSCDIVASTLSIECSTPTATAAAPVEVDDSLPASIYDESPLDLIESVPKFTEVEDCSPPLEPRTTTAAVDEPTSTTTTTTDRVTQSLTAIDTATADLSPIVDSGQITNTSGQITHTNGQITHTSGVDASSAADIVSSVTEVTGSKKQNRRPNSLLGLACASAYEANVQPESSEITSSSKDGYQETNQQTNVTKSNECIAAVNSEVTSLTEQCSTDQVCHQVVNTPKLSDVNDQASTSQSEFSKPPPPPPPFAATVTTTSSTAATIACTSASSSQPTPSSVQSTSDPSEPGQVTAEQASSSSPTETVPVVAPPSTAIPRLSIIELGLEAPVWVPDNEASTCAQCSSKFTFTKRRHHCRCCGKVFCSNCSNFKKSLIYNENKEARVCSVCHVDLLKADEFRNTQLSSSSSVVTAGVLRKQGSLRKPTGDSKQVMFSDGVRPGGDLMDGEQRPVTSRHSKKKHSSTTSKYSKIPSGCLITSDDNVLPPILVSEKDMIIDIKPEIIPTLAKLKNNEIINFLLNRNLIIKLQIVNLSCCLNRVCLCLVSNGLSRVGQDELVIVLAQDDDQRLPIDVIRHLSEIYDNACQGETITHMKHSVVKQHNEHYSGFFFFKPTFQCLQNLPFSCHSGTPYLIGVMLQRWEMLWAEILPLRLMLRFGAEYRYYPCPIMSERLRKPVYVEIGHTIMKLLADFTNYKYKLQTVNGVVIHMQDKVTDILFPKNRYKEIVKVINSSNDYVLAFAGCFSELADSHLICMQTEDGTGYQTQAINILLKPRKITGASFIVFNGALKATSGYKARSSIVEDGVMVQVNSDTLSSLKQSIVAREDFTIECGPIVAPVNDSGTEQAAPVVEETVNIKWIDDDNSVNSGIISPIDGKDMSGISSIRLHKSAKCARTNRSMSPYLKWTEIFFISSQQDDRIDLLRLAETLSKSTASALDSFLMSMRNQTDIVKIALRVEINSELVGYKIGANGEKLDNAYTEQLDNALIPIIHSIVEGDYNNEFNTQIELELLFHVID